MGVKLTFSKRPFIATNQWCKEISMDLNMWLNQKQIEIREEAAEKFEAAQQQDPEMGLVTYRMPDIGAIIRTSSASNTLSRNLANPNRGVLQLFNLAELDMRSSVRPDITVYPKWQGMEGRPMVIKGWKGKAYPYWAVIEYGSHAPRGYFIRYFPAQGGWGAFMQPRSIGGGTGQASLVSKNRQKLATMPSGAQYIKGWPPKPGYRILSKIRNRVQWEFNNYVSDLLRQKVSQLGGAR